MWVNAATVLDAGLALQVLAVLGATATVCAVTVATGAWPPYVLAGAWAFTGVLVSGLEADQPALWRTAVGGLLATALASTVSARRRLQRTDTGRRTPAPGSRWAARA